MTRVPDPVAYRTVFVACHNGGGVEVFTEVPGTGAGFLRVTDHERRVAAVWLTPDSRARLAAELAAVHDPSASESEVGAG